MFPDSTQSTGAVSTNAVDLEPRTAPHAAPLPTPNRPIRSSRRRSGRVWPASRSRPRRRDSEAWAQTPGAARRPAATLDRWRRRPSRRPCRRRREVRRYARHRCSPTRNAAPAVAPPPAPQAAKPRPAQGPRPWPMGPVPAASCGTALAGGRARIMCTGTPSHL